MKKSAVKRKCSSSFAKNHIRKRHQSIPCNAQNILPQLRFVKRDYPSDANSILGRCRKINQNQNKILLTNIVMYAKLK